MDPQLQRNLVALYDAREYEQVVNATNDAVTESSVKDSWYVLRVYALYFLKRYDEAAEGFRRLYDAKPQDQQSLLILMACLLKLRQFDKMFDVATQSYATFPAGKIGLQIIEIGLKVRAPAAYISRIFRELFPDFFGRHTESKVIVSQHTSLRNWCAENQITMVELDPSVNVQIKDVLTGTDLSYVSQSTEVAIIPEAAVVCGWDYPFTSNGQVLNDVGYLPMTSKLMSVPHVASPYDNYVASLWADVIEVDEDVFFLSCPDLSAFGHWLIDFLPRLVVWSQQRNSKLKIFCPANLPDHFKESLKRFGISQDQLCEGELYRAYKFKTLTVCRLGHWGARSALVNEFIYKHLGPPADYQVPHGMTEKLVFLERSQTSRGRLIINKAEFAQTLEVFNVRTMRRPELSIAEQDKVLWNAGVVISAYGTDILAVYQLRRGTDLMVFYFEDVDELSEEGELGISLARICALLGVRLTRVYCSAAPDDKRVGYKRDLVVNCAQFSRQLNEILNRRNYKHLT